MGIHLEVNEKANIDRYKARLVAQGCRQIKGINYEEVFLPVVNFSVIRFPPPCKYVKMETFST